MRTLACFTAAFLALTAVGQPRQSHQDDAERLELWSGRSTQLEAPWALEGVSVTDPEVADVQLGGAAARARVATNTPLWL